MSIDETALVPVNIEDFSMDIKGVQQQVTELHELYKKTMTKGNHYGVIPGTTKPSLWKPGAELILVRSRLRPEVRSQDSIERDDFISFTITLDLFHIPTGNLVGQGVGSCNSREKEYWSENPWKYHNNILKMAKKRALVDAVLNATAASEIFTQDTEDLVGSPALNTPAPAPVTEPEVIDVDPDTGEVIQPAPDTPDSQRAEIGRMLQEMCAGDEEREASTLETITEWTDKKGQLVQGRRDVGKLTDKQMPVVYGKVKMSYLSWKVGANKNE